MRTLAEIDTDIKRLEAEREEVRKANASHKLFINYGFLSPQRGP